MIPKNLLMTPKPSYRFTMKGCEVAHLELEDGQWRALLGPSLFIPPEV